MFGQLIKTATEIVVSAGASTIVSTVIKQAMPDNLSKYKKITVVAGTIALSGAAASAASKYAGDQVDAVIKVVQLGPVFKDELAKGLQKSKEDIQAATEGKQVVLNTDGVHVESKDETDTNEEK